MFESLSYIPAFNDTYEWELGQLESAAESAVAYVDRETKKLIRSDGSQVYSPAEHAERVAAIQEAAGEQFDRAVARHVAKAESDVADLEKKLARLEGEDGWGRLNADEQVKAGARREFIKEDVAALPAAEVAKRARAAIAAGDKAACYLYLRYIDQRTSVAGPDGMPAIRAGGTANIELLAVLRDLGALFGADERGGLRKEIAEKLRAARALPLAITKARSIANGSDERARAQFSQHVLARW